MSTPDDKGSSLPTVSNELPEDNIIELQKSTKVDLKKLIRLNNIVPELSLRDKGKALNCSYNTVHVLNQKLEHIQGVVEHFKVNRADLLVSYQASLLSSLMTDKPLKDIPFRDKIIAYGILSDKEHREREKGSTVQGLSQIFKGIHIDIKAGTITVLSPFPHQESPKVVGDDHSSGDVVIDIEPVSDEPSIPGDEGEHGQGE